MECYHCHQHKPINIPIERGFSGGARKAEYASELQEDWDYDCGCNSGSPPSVMGNLGKPLNFPLVWTRTEAVEPRHSNWYCAARFTCEKGNFCTIVSEHSM